MTRTGKLCFDCLRRAGSGRPARPIVWPWPFWVFSYVNNVNMMFRNRLQYLLFLVSIAGTTGMKMSIENNMLHLLCQTN